MDFTGTDGMVVRLQYDARFGEETDQHSGTAKLAVSY